MSRRLNATFVRSVKSEERTRNYGDGRGGHGLTLVVQPNGVKYWYQRLRIGRRPANIGLGGYPLVSLSEARSSALANARVAKSGGDPRRSRRADIPTVAQTIEVVLERDAPTWRNPEKAMRDWRSAMNRHAEALMDLPVDSITSAQCISVLIPLWNTKRETALRVKRRLASVFKLAIAEGHRTDNPVETASVALPSRRGDAQRPRKHAALPYAEVARALATMERSRAWTGAKLAFRFLVLTAARNGEVRGAKWSEVDLDEALWIIPAERMKAGVEHRVPLSTAAMDVLTAARKLDQRSRLVFPSRRGKTLHHATFNQLLHGLRIPAVPHGFRSSFRDWAAEQTSAPHAIMESALAHQVGNRVEAAYFRSDLLDKRRVLMQLWSDYITRSESGSSCDLKDATVCPCGGKCQKKCHA